MAASAKFVLITGCSAGGIGSGLAEAFQEKGYHVFATLRNPSKISPKLSQASNVTVLQLDVLSSTSIAAAVESVNRQTGGRLDVLINNSGGGITAPTLDSSIEEGKKLFDLNFWAPIAMIQAFAPLLIKAKGCIVNNSSASAVVPMLLNGIYNGSKAALATTSETLRLELQPLGVRTITLITCAVKTNFFNDYHSSEIPDTSYYYAIRDFIYSFTDGRLQKDGISPRQYGATVVQAVEKGSSGHIWVGGGAFINHWAWYFSPRSIRDIILQGLVPIDKELAKVAQGRKARIE